MRNHKILVTGAGGQLGIELVQLMKQNGLDVCGFTKNELDILNEHQLEKRFSEVSPTFVMHCAAYTAVDQAEEDVQAAFAINTLGTRNVARACNKFDAALIYISTDYVFDGRSDRPYHEQDCTLPINTYGISKLAGEHLIRANMEKYFIFRVSSLFGIAGTSGRGSNFVETMIRLAKEGKSLKVVSDQIMSPTYALDAAEAMLAFVKQDVQAYGIYHCSGEGQCSWYDFAQEIFRQLGMHADLSPVLHTEYATKAVRPLYSVLENAKLSPIYRMPHWKDALQEYLKLRLNGLNS